MRDILSVRVGAPRGAYEGHQEANAQGKGHISNEEVHSGCVGREAERQHTHQRARALSSHGGAARYKDGRTRAAAQVLLGHTLTRAMI